MTFGHGNISLCYTRDRASRFAYLQSETQCAKNSGKLSGFVSALTVEGAKCQTVLTVFALNAASNLQKPLWHGFGESRGALQTLGDGYEKYNDTLDRIT